MVGGRSMVAGSPEPLWMTSRPFWRVRKWGLVRWDGFEFALLFSTPFVLLLLSSVFAENCLSPPLATCLSILVGGVAPSGDYLEIFLFLFENDEVSALLCRVIPFWGNLL